jgi:ABC-type oligopeptide transport system substrate-binding subunit
LNLNDNWENTMMRDRKTKALSTVLLLAACLGVSACSSSFGSGSSPPDNAVVLPDGAHVVCANGSTPPCK